MTRRALVASMSSLASDPRVRREIDWLLDAGWTVDTLGIGAKPDERVGEHFATGRAPSWTNPRVAKGLMHAVLPYAARYRLLQESLISSTLRAAGASYDLVVLNDVDLVPWMVGRGQAILAPGGRIHLDLHEWHVPGPRATDLTAMLIRGYQSWMTDHLGSDAIASRSTVSPGLGELYMQQYGVPPLSIVRSVPDFTELAPSPVDPDAIELSYHGIADPTRGLGLFAEMMSLLEPRFRLNLMLTGPQADQEALRGILRDHLDRVSFHEPVQVTEIAERINEWDISLMFFPPVRQNLVITLPNKFFEAIQGRLAIVTGRSPEMVRLIEQHAIGVVVEGWTATDLAAAINALSAAEIQAMKESADRAAYVLNAAAEGEIFLTAVS